MCFYVQSSDQLNVFLYAASVNETHAHPHCMKTFSYPVKAACTN